jgi:predicted amidohydrolase YtcJ
LPFFLFAQKKGTEINDYSKWSEDISLDMQRKSSVGHIDYFVEGAGENLVADAADFENFLLPRPELPPTMEANLKAVLQVLVRNRWPFRIHATYNESISRDLAVIEEVNRETPLNGLVWFIDHAETISEENIQTIKRLGGGIAIQNRMSFQGEGFIRRYGLRAAAAAPPLRSMLAAGIPVGLGTDGTRVSSYNPWIALYWITTGKSVGGNQVMSSGNTVDRLTALHLLSSGGYGLIREDHNKGKIKQGYLADIVILNKDYFSVDNSLIPSIRSLLTIVDGKPVYGAGEYESYAPAALSAIPKWSPVNYYQYKVPGKNQ